MKQYRTINWKKLDVISIILMTMLICVGVYCIKQVDDASVRLNGLYSKQLLGVAIGTVVLIATLFVDYRLICRYSFLLYTIIVIVLAYTFKFGDAINKVRRWVTIAGIQLQPSELAKMILILFLAYLCDQLRERMDRFSTLLILGAAVGLPVILIMLEPHLSTSLAIVLIFCAMVYLSGISYKIIFTSIVLIVPIFAAVIIGVGVYNIKIPFIKQYQVQRILTHFSSDDSESADGKYQQDQAMAAIADGGSYGKLLDKEDSTKMYEGIYAHESDFVFTVVGEEFGFIGSTIVIVLYVLLILRCFFIGIHAPDYLGRMVCLGVSSMFMFQVFINIGVATSLLPNTGLPLPFISYGLTSLINSMFAIAVVINVGLRRTR